MDAINNAQIALYGGATVGALTAVLILTTWLRKLLNLDGRAVNILSALVAAWIAGTLFLIPVYPVVSTISGFVIATALLATGADAFWQQQKSTTPPTLTTKQTDIVTITTTPPADAEETKS